MTTQGSGIEVRRLFVKFGADLGDLLRGSDQADKRLASVGKNITAAGKTMTKWVTGPIAAVGVGLVALAKKTGDYADRILDLTDITGMSAKSIQEWQYVAAQAGVSTEAVTHAVEGLVRRLPQLEFEGGRVTEQLGKLGLSFADLETMAPDEMIDKLIGSLAAMEDPLERNAIGSALFGGAWKDIAPILGMGAAGIDEARRRAGELGLVLSDEALAGANKFRQAMVELGAVLGGAGRRIGAELAPLLTDILLPALRDKIVPAVTSFAAKIGELIGWFRELSPAGKSAIAVAIGYAFALGPLLMITGKLITGFANLRSGTGALNNALKYLAANPIILVVAGIAALVAAGIWLWKNWDQVTTWIKDAWASVGEWFGPVYEKMKELFPWLESFVAWLGEAWQKVSGWIAESIAGIVEDVMWLIDKIKLVLDWLDRLPKGKDSVYEAAPTSASARVAGGGVPGMATGGHVTGAGWADVGEHGRERLFLPRGATVVPLAAGSGRGGGDVTLNNVFNIHASTAAIGKQTAQEAADALWRRFREAGTL